MDNHNNNNNNSRHHDFEMTQAELDFHRYRHLSRYERAYRVSHGLDLQEDWDGRYNHNNNNNNNNDDDVEEDIMEDDDDDDEDDDYDEHPLDSAYTTTTTNRTGSALHQNGTVVVRRFNNESTHETILPPRLRWNNHDGRRRRQLQSISPVVEDGDQADAIGMVHEQQQQQQQQQRSKYAYSSKSYQAAPLSQGYGTHYAHIWVGTPKAQRKSVIVDTGSHYTAFPCKGCENCGEEHHTDPYFDPTQSRTFRPLTCNQCQLGAMCYKQRCIVRQSYTEGSSWEAYQVRDQLYLGGKDVLASADPKHTKYTMEFMFGCQQSENGLFVTQLADGIMGMSAHDLTITKQLYEQHKIPHNVFGLCFRRELGTSKRGITAGVITIGGHDNRLDSSPTLFAQNIASSGWYTVYVKNIFIRAGGGQTASSILKDDEHVLKIPLDLNAVNSGKGVIVDSGTTDTYLHKKLAKSFAAVWKQVTKKEYSHNGIILTDEQLRRLPTILVQCRANDYRTDPSMGDPQNIIGLAGNLDPLSPYDVVIAIPATNYMEYSPTTNLYTSRLYFTETHGGVLGANAMQGHNVIFDWENGRVGFAESTCDYMDEHSILEDQTSSSGSGHIPSDAAQQQQHFLDLDATDSHSIIGGGIHGDDCILSEPILTRSCVESVDTTTVCQSPGAHNVVLEGREIWTMRVENPGTSAGMSCGDAALLESPYTGELPPTIECNGKGTCQEHRPCELACQDVPKAEAILLEDEQTSDKNSPCPLRWSACDYGCEQTMVMSLKKSDGNCHQFDEGSRVCHKDACGVSDPCRVPYLVHTVLGFKGALKHLWAPRFVEILSLSLEAAGRSHFKTANEPYFTVGDINVVMVTPWREDTGDRKEEIGIKVILQISFFNKNAQVIEEEDVIDGADSSGAGPPPNSGFNPLDDAGSSLDGGGSTRASAGGDGDGDGEENGRKFHKVVADNVKKMIFNRPIRTTRTSCSELDLYELARHAQEVNAMMEEGGEGEGEFMNTLIGEMKKAEGGDSFLAMSPFQTIYNDSLLRQESRVLSTWTVRAEPEEGVRLTNGIVPGTIRQYAFNTNFMVGFLCFSIFFCAWAYERRSKGQPILPGNAYASLLVMVDLPQRFHAMLLMRQQQQQQMENDDQLFDRLFGSTSDDDNDDDDDRKSRSRRNKNNSNKKRAPRLDSISEDGITFYHDDYDDGPDGADNNNNKAAASRRMTASSNGRKKASSLPSMNHRKTTTTTTTTTSNRRMPKRRVANHHHHHHNWDLGQELQAGDLELARRGRVTVTGATTTSAAASRGGSSGGGGVA